MVLLGDVVPRTNMSQPLTAGVFSEPGRSLWVWFSSDGGKNLTQLAPDTHLASVPFALQVEQSRERSSLIASAMMIILATRYFRPSRLTWRR